MINNNKILALIPARGGSKGIKNKNIINLVDKPLIAYTIEKALCSKYIDSVVVSTDSNKIKNVSLKYGARVPFMRPKIFATDTAKTIDSVVHAIDTLKSLGENYDFLILLQPTVPLRNTQDIDGALEFFESNKYKSVASVCEVNNYPELIRTMNESNVLFNILNERSDKRRQQMKNYFYVNGAIYINRICEINKDTILNDNMLGYFMPLERSVDIDTRNDLLVTDTLIRKERE